MDLSIIIVNWNTAALLTKCIDSIEAETKSIQYEIIINDNNSSDESCKIIKESYPEVTLIESKQNLGFSKGNNNAVKYAKGEYLLFLNPDTLIKNKAIEKTFYYIKSLSKKTLVGCKLLNADGTIQLSSASFPNIINIIFATHPKSIKIHCKNHETDWVMGAFMMINTKIFKEIGCFDEEYFMYSEELDLCYRLKKKHGKVFYYAGAEIIHFYNQSGLQKWNNKREEMVKKSTNLFFEKNYPFITAIIYRMIYNLRFSLKRYIKQYKKES